MVLLSIFFKHLSLVIATLQVYYSDISLILYPRVGHRHPLIRRFQSSCIFLLKVGQTGIS